MPTVLLGIGANLGDPARQLQQCVDQLARDWDVRSVSTWVSSPAVGGPSGQPQFLNGAVRLRTELSPQDLLPRLLAVEEELGRVRRRRWAARTLDLDILLYDSRIIQSRRLCIPHPWMAVRSFVIRPAAEIGGQLRHPVIGLELRQIWQQLRNPRGAVAILDGSPTAVDNEQIADPFVDWSEFAGRAGWQSVPAATAAAAVEWPARPGDGEHVPFVRPLIWLMEARETPVTADGSIRGYIVIAPPVPSPIETDAAALRKIISPCPAPAVFIRPTSPRQQTRLVRAALDGMKAIT